MRWSSLSIATQQGELSRSEVRDYIGLKSDNTGHNALIDRIRLAVVADAEFYLRRAIFTQTRSFTARADGYCERARREFQFEPMRGASFEINGAARAFIDGIIRGERPDMDLAFSRHTLQTALAVYEAAAAERAVAVDGVG